MKIKAVEQAKHKTHAASTRKKFKIGRILAANNSLRVAMAMSVRSNRKEKNLEKPLSVRAKVCRGFGEKKRCRKKYLKTFASNHCRVIPHFIAFRSRNVGTWFPFCIPPALHFPTSIGARQTWQLSVKHFVPQSSTYRHTPLFPFFLTTTRFAVKLCGKVGFFNFKWHVARCEPVKRNENHLQKKVRE